MPRTIFPDRFRVLSGSALKVIATIAMLIAHTATAFHSELNTISFFSVRGVNISLFWIMEMIGKISFPIFVFWYLRALGTPETDSDTARCCLFSRLFPRSRGI